MSTSQRLRRILTLASALLFPATFIYLSPAVPFEAATEGILSGSVLVFAAVTVAALVFGRAWCGWLCPGAGLSDQIDAVDGRPFRPDWARRIKYGVWAIWLAALGTVMVFVGPGIRSVEPAYMTEYGLSAHAAHLLAIYFGVVMVLVVPTALCGRRGFCHTLCWMAPFMVIGRKLGNALRLPRLQLVANGAACNDCGRCGKTCPMSLPLADMVRSGRMEKVDCVLCGACTERCPRHVLKLGFGR